MMRRALATAALLLIVGAMLGAQSSYVIVDSVRLPAESYVGDTVELRYSIRTQANPTVPDEIPQPRWGRIDSLRVIPGTGQFDLRLTVIPFEPGTLTLPRINLGELRLDGLNLLVTSILPEGDAELRSVHGPQRLPRTRAALLLSAFAVSFLVALTLYALGPGRRHVRSLVGRYRARLPYRRLLAHVHSLQRDMRQYSIREFYISLVSHLQVFMSSRVDRECRAATSTELVALLAGLEAACGAPPGSASALEEVFIAADEVKFAHRSVRKPKREKHLEIVAHVVTHLESYRRRIRKLRHGREPVHVGA